MSDEVKYNRIKELLDASNDIYSKLYQHKDTLKSIHESSSVPYNDIIDFADNITLTLSAPRLYRDGLPLIASHAPCPQFYEMRLGKLSSFNSSNVVKDILNNGKKNNEEMSIERKINIMQERQVTRNIDSNSNKRKRNDDIVSNEEKEDARPLRRLKEEPKDILVSKSEVKTGTAVTNNTTSTITAIPKAEAKSSEKSNITKTTVVAPRRVINISFGLSDSESDND